MNEKIRELFHQAYGYPIDVVGEQAEKFAELIVQECIGITDELVNRNPDGTWTSNELYTDYNGALFLVKRRIGELFGVEE